MMTLTALARNLFGTSENFSCFTPELNRAADFSPSTDKSLGLEVRISHAVAGAIENPQWTVIKLFTKT